MFIKVLFPLLPVCSITWNNFCFLFSFFFIQTLQWNATCLRISARLVEWVDATRGAKVVLSLVGVESVTGYMLSSLGRKRKKWEWWQCRDDKGLNLKATKRYYKGGGGVGLSRGKQGLSPCPLTHPFSLLSRPPPIFACLLFLVTENLTLNSLPMNIQGSCESIITLKELSLYNLLKTMMLELVLKKCCSQGCSDVLWAWESRFSCREYPWYNHKIVMCKESWNLSSIAYFVMEIKQQHRKYS